MAIYNEQDTALMLASTKVTGVPLYTGQIIYTFIGGRLSNSKPVALNPINEISRLFKGFPLPVKKVVHLVVEMTNGLVQRKEAKA